MRSSITPFFALVSLAVFVSGQTEIRAVSLLFRHGERTPGAILPGGTAPITAELGAGQLTLTGSRQLYDVGDDLRKRYLHLFPTSGYFRQSNMNVLTSPVPRCVASLTSFMAGFFPPPANDKTIPFRWQSHPFVMDNEQLVVVIGPKTCPAYLRELATATAAFNANVTNWIAQDKAILDQLGAYFGVPMNDIRYISAVGDAVQANKYLTKQPQWILNALDSTLIKYARGYFQTFLSTEYSRKVHAGNLISQMINNMVAIRDGTATARNFLIFSGHDSTLSAFNQALKVDSQMPDFVEYGDTMALELLQVGKAKELQVRLVYVTNKKKVILNIPNCGQSCSLAVFIQSLEHMYISDWNTFCNA